MRVNSAILPYGVLLIGLTAAGTILAPAAQAGNKISVCKSFDDGPRHKHCDYSKIQDAIDVAVSGDRIDVGRGVYEENLVINRNQNISIIGQSARKTTIDGKPGSPTISLSCSPTAKINIANVTITGGDLLSTGNPIGGAGIKNSGCYLTLFDAEVSGNTVSGPGFTYGAGIANLHGTLAIIDTTVSGNQLIATTSALTTPTGGGIYNDTGVVNVKDSSVAGNKLTRTSSGTYFRGQGGGIFNDSGTITVVDSTITDNSAEGINDGVPSGGGIENVSGKVQIFGSNIARNTTTGNGAGISTSGSFLLKGSSVRRNVANPLAGLGGGAFVGATGTLNIVWSNVNRNTAKSGGGLYTTAGGVVSAVGATIRANTPDQCAGDFSC